DGAFLATVTEARHVGEISLVSLALAEMPGAVIRLTLSGPARLEPGIGQSYWVDLDLRLIHVMPLRHRP
ncbi:hypothetical protein, partial [Streptococcus pyogenes]